MVHYELLGLAAHKLRTPATIIKQYLGLALDGYTEPLTPKQRQLIKKAYESNERQLQIINDLLCVASASAGTTALTLKQTNVTDLVCKAIEAHRTQLAGKRQQVQSAPGESAYAQVDPFFLSIALNHLLASCIQRTPEGGTIVVELSVKGAALHIMFYHGAKQGGVLPRLLKKLPKSEHRQTTASTDGELGLYFADKVARLHGGVARAQLDADNRPVLRLVLPIRQGKKHYSTERQPSYNRNVAL